MTGAMQERDAEIIRLRKSGMVTDDVAAELGISRNVVCKVWWKYDTKGIAPDGMSPPEKILPLEAWQGTDGNTDLPRWRDTQTRLERDNRYLIVEHDNDNHFPYHDPNAQAMRSRIRQRVQPDIIIVGSDAADFPTISRFEADKSIPAGRVLTRFRDPWHQHVQRLQYDAPEAALRWIDGNHDIRAWEHIQNSDDYNLLYEYHVDTIRADGAVMWPGTVAQAQEVLIADTLAIVHGWKATKYTGAAMLREYSKQVCLMAGHSHRPELRREAGRIRAVWAMIGGCGALLNPHYMKRRPFSNWQHTYSYAIVDTETQTAIPMLVDFMHTGDSIWCWHDGDVLTVDKEPVEYYEVNAA